VRIQVVPGAILSGAKVVSRFGALKHDGGHERRFAVELRFDPCNLCLIVLIQSALLGLPLLLHALERLLVGLHPLALLVLDHRRRGAPHLLSSVACTQLRLCATCESVRRVKRAVRGLRLRIELGPFTVRDLGVAHRHE